MNTATSLNLTQNAQDYQLLAEAHQLHIRNNEPKVINFIVGIINETHFLLGITYLAVQL